jgi:KipI family sensor histidine kinase inhibitor
VTVRLLPYGDAAVLLEVPDNAAALAWYADLRARPPAGVVDVVPADCTVLVRLDPGRTDVASVLADLSARTVVPASLAEGPLVTIPVTYDGPDLDGVAEACGWSVVDLVAEHQARTWQVAFVGFAPGFGYLRPDGAWPQVPRRSDPRTGVPAGAVALGGGYAGIYPAASPGGWQVIGHTGLVVWDVERDPPAMLAPGTRVRFVERP